MMELYRAAEEFQREPQPVEEKRKRPIELPRVLDQLELCASQRSRCRELLQDMKKYHLIRSTDLLHATALYILRLEYSFPWNDEAISSWTGVPVVQFQRM